MYIQLSSFATSTPIKKDKENTRTSGHVSPTYLSPSESSETKRPRLRGTTHDVSDTQLVGVLPYVCVYFSLHMHLLSRPPVEVTLKSQ